MGGDSAVGRAQPQLPLPLPPCAAAVPSARPRAAGCNPTRTGQAAAAAPAAAPAGLGVAPRPHGADAIVRSPPQLEPGSSDCGTERIDLVIGVLAAPTARSKVSRQLIRDTWATLPTPGKKVLIKFLLALDPRHGNVPQQIMDEGKEKGDIVILPTKELYENLSEKVRLYFKWAVDWCDAAYMFKTDLYSIVIF